ncbi:hypothetical protein NO932_11785 [Pelagibacterium sp. 26DY04]|uniref:hypothetical protein n=1 Tax=Pelagibacterium sp. 26DY04 TaxID=2967130 RepID=UPI00281604CA|nr:hypothetical protein [Pelagibacterium sp. 26DY04]WMT85609.1 hypothetical protein NO932_11785 [Pelagibacterium sp. 26DY04]
MSAADPMMVFFSQKARALADANDLGALKALIDEAVEDKRKGFGPPLSEINTAIDLEQKLKREGEAA